MLNRRFVLDQLDLVRTQLESDAQRPVEADAQPQGVTAEDVKSALRECAAAQQREDRQSSGQAGYDDDPDARRGAEPAPIDDTVFLSHDPIVSILQSALDAYFRERGVELVDSQPPEDDRRGDDGFVAITDEKIAGCEVLPRSDDGRRLFDKFSVTDPGWVSSLVAMGVRQLRSAHAFNDQQTREVRVANNARLIIVGDWGSGIRRAIEVGRQMREIVDDGCAKRIEQHVVHLGDVYYSGWEFEYRKRFLPHWPVQEGEESDLLKSWCLNGNHDMYSGGHAYFDFLLANRLFQAQQRSSFFALRNDYWDILGLDTAHEDEGLRDPQLEWIKRQQSGSNRRSMWLSHHQLFSAYEKPCQPLQRKIDSYLQQHPVDVWFWGHEHRCVFYREHEGVRNARLIGNGGVPVYMTHPQDAAQKPPSFYEYRAFIRKLLEKWAYLGFAVVDLDGPLAKVRYIDEAGNTFKTEQLP